MSNMVMISNIQRFSTEDGDGIRTTVFFKGCNLRCRWCHNPETIPAAPVLLYYAHLCRGCGACVAACQKGAHLLLVGAHSFSRAECINCGTCAAACPSGALALNGRSMAAGEVAATVLRDREYYAASGGGVTLSGGEPLLQPDAAAEIARICSEQGVNVIIDTAGCVPFAAFERVLPFVDTYFFDLKGTTGQEYLANTGGSLATVLDNMARLAEGGRRVVASLPIIPGHSDSTEYAERAAQLISTAGVKQARLLPFHRYGADKYAAMGLGYEYKDTSPPDGRILQAMLLIFQEYGIKTKIE